ncbi:hypothetical protein ACSTS3_21650 [Aquimarina muelleri]|uniref:hypothetical protein n=1 Tax=Aquimarina muelleri TaxID=279356 RepID=UPI003F682E4D
MRSGGKAKSLNSALAWVQSGNNGSKMLQLDVKEFVSQTAYEKLLCGEFKTLEKLDEFNRNRGTSKIGIKQNWYTCFYYTKEENGRIKYLIDSIFLR